MFYGSVSRPIRLAKQNNQQLRKLDERLLAVRRKRQELCRMPISAAAARVHGNTSSLASR